MRAVHSPGRQQGARHLSQFVGTIHAGNLSRCFALGQGLHALATACRGCRMPLRNTITVRRSSMQTPKLRPIRMTDGAISLSLEPCRFRCRLVDEFLQHLAQIVLDRRHQLTCLIKKTSRPVRSDPSHQPRQNWSTSDNTLCVFSTSGRKVRHIPASTDGIRRYGTTTARGFPCTWPRPADRRPTLPDALDLIGPVTDALIIAGDTREGHRSCLIDVDDAFVHLQRIVELQRQQR